MTELLAGTSGFQYKFWRGSFYSPKCREADMLGEYGAQLPTVEINATFYRMPRREVLEGWTGKVPDAFRFALKASRRITHVKRLKDVGEPLSYLCQAARGLGSRLGCLLFQLPPSARCDQDRLEAFLALVPDDVKVAMEFRHPSWFDEGVYRLLREHNAALCISDQGEGEAATPFVSTADWGYLRLRRESYSQEELSTFAGRIDEQGWARAFAYFKHEEQAPAFARRLLESAAAR